MLLAELEVLHSRPIAPTRRIAVGPAWLPGAGDGCSPSAGALLLGAVCARFGPGLTDDMVGEVMALIHELEQRQSVAQPRLRHRLQSDRVGLTRSRQRLYGSKGVGGRLGPANGRATPSAQASRELRCEFEGSRATPSQLVLGAVYAAGLAAPELRSEALRAVRRGLAWRGAIGAALFAYLLNGLAADQRTAQPARAVADPVGWALEILGLEPEADPPAQAVVRRGFREALRAAHPDLGAAEAEAADRISELSEARRILLTQ